MRKWDFLWVLGLFSLMFFAACSNDDDEGTDGPNGSNGNMSMLHGTWKEAKEECYKNGQVVPGYGRSMNYKWVFRKDNSLVYFGTNYLCEGTYAYQGKWLTLDYEHYGTEEHEKHEILKLTADSLIWKEDYPDSEFDYKILHMTRSTSEYDDPFEAVIVNSYTGKVKEIVEKYKDKRNIIGCWYSGGQYIFTSDMKVHYASGSSSSTYDGAWDWNADQKVLGTTVLGRTWNITVLTPFEMAGIHVSSSNVYTFRKWHFVDKYDREYFKDPNIKELIVGEWVKEGDGTVIYIEENLNYRYKYNGFNRVIEGSGKLDNDLHIEDTQIMSVSGNVLLIGSAKNYNPKQFEGEYVFQNK